MAQIFKSIGLMSGTSLDGVIDVALVETDGVDYVKPLGFYAHGYDVGVRDKVRACFGRRDADAATNVAEDLVTDVHIEAVKASGFEADLIGFHGQTITHDPPSRDALRRDKSLNGFTWQLGDGGRMARECGMDVVCDFRSADMKAGGQGAPLAPLYHQAITEELEKPVAILNLGGVANVTYIGSSDCHSGEGQNLLTGNDQIPVFAGMTAVGGLIAFDTGPANALMDDYCLKHFKQAFDTDGAIAESGKADKAAVGAFLARDYFKAAPPKSLDRNDFEAVLGSLPDDPKDAMATLAVMSAAGVMAAVKHFPRVPNAWYVCGGGRRNGFMMRLLEDMLMPSRVMGIEALGFDGDAIEAQAFAYLAVRSKLGLPLSMPSTTGVAEPQTGGVYHTHD